MCGIAGAVGGCGPVVQAAVGRIQRALTHRGPDDQGAWQQIDPAQRGVVLAHRRLAILDLSPRGHQPMRDPQTGDVIIFNGEIYNFRALRRELEASGARFESETDTEVILKAYGRWGIECVARLAGMFAFALWDAQANTLHIVRDRLGVKPVYVTRLENEHGPPTVLFASELRALLASGLVPRRLDPTALATTVWHGFPIEPRTMIEGVRLLGAGQRVTAAPSGRLSAPITYWSPPSKAEAADAKRDGDDPSHATLAALKQSIESRLISDAPLGVFLSGGVDSTAVAAVAARASDAPVRTFSVTFDESGYDESAFAREAAKRLGTAHQTLHLSEARFADQLEDGLGCLDQPSFDALNTYVISRAVREAGLTVALSGTGGDELFGGYRSFRDLPWAQQWSRRMRRVPAPLRRVAAKAVMRWQNGPPGAVPPQTRWGKLDDALNSEGDLAALYQTDYALFSQAFFERLFDGRANAAGGATGFGLEPAQLDARRAAIKNQSTLAAIARLERMTFLQQRLLRDTDAASMASSLEVRVPLVDHTVLERATALDDAQRFAPLGRKRLLQKLAAPEVPASFFDRPKAGFVLPIERWAHARLGRQIDRTLRDGALCRSVGLSPEAVASLWQAFQQNAPGIYWSRVWTLFTLLRWCERHGVTLDGQGAPERSDALIGNRG
jgi:asparagine synthase (glutamine-hydrolysing)